MKTGLERPGKRVTYIFPGSNGVSVSFLNSALFVCLSQMLPELARSILQIHNRLGLTSILRLYLAHAEILKTSPCVYTFNALTVRNRNGAATAKLNVIHSFTTGDRHRIGAGYNSRRSVEVKDFVQERN